MSTFNRRDAINLGLLGGAAVGGAMLPILTKGAIAAESAQAPIGNMSQAMADALQRYNDRLVTIQKKIYSHPWTKRADVRAQADDYFMQLTGQAWMNVLSQRELFPRFNRNTVNEPLLATVLFMCPDFMYQMAWLDSTKTYRIKGINYGSLFLDFQVQCDVAAADPATVQRLNADIKAPFYVSLGNEIKAGPDGKFEIIVSAKEHPGNWLRMGKAWPTTLIGVREGIYDWLNDKPSYLDIELIGDTPRTVDEPEDVFIKRMDRAGRLIEYYYDFFANKLVEEHLKRSNGEFNKWANQSLPFAVYGSTQRGRYMNLAYDIADDEALIFELDDPGGDYWGFQLADLYVRGTDPAYFQSSLNGLQAAKDSDGRYRMVLANHDPGVPNWLDTAGRLTGFARLRQYHQKKDVGLPTSQKVKLSAVRKHLPKDTPRVTRAQRKAVIEKRRLGLMRRYGNAPYEA